MSLGEAISEWSSWLGHDNVLDRDRVPRKFRSDTGGHGANVAAVVQLNEAADIPGILRIAQRHGVKIHPVSTGNNWGYGSALPVQENACVLDLSRLRKIIAFDEELGVVTVEPGVTQGMLAAFLEQNQHPFMVPVTGAGPDCSLVGNALERGYGITPISDHHAAVMDMEVVLADGGIHRSTLAALGCTRLARSYKWDIGPHLDGLFSQSGLGVVRSMSIALAPRPACVKACVFKVTDLGTAIECVPLLRQAIGRLGGSLGGINLMNSHRILGMVGKHPNDEEGSCDPLTATQLSSLERGEGIAAWTGFASLYGSSRVVATAQRELRSILGKKVGRMLFLDQAKADQIGFLARFLPGRMGARAARQAKTLRNALGLLRGRPNETTLPLAYWLDHRKLPPVGTPLDPARDGCGLIWYSPLVPMSPVCVESAVRMVYSVAGKHRVDPLITLTSLNDRLFDCTVPILFRSEQPGRLDAARRCYFEMVESGRQLGIYPYRLGAFGMDLVHAKDDQDSNLHARIRTCLDPHDTLSPGRYL